MTTDIIKFKLKSAENAGSPEETAKALRGALFDAVEYIYEKAGIPEPKQATLLELLDSNVVGEFVEYDEEILKSLHLVRIVGMNAEHGRPVRRKDVKLAAANMEFLYSLLAGNATVCESGIIVKPGYMSEAETRKIYIDVYLQEAGWEVLETEDLVAPGKAGIEIQVEGMPNEHGIGFCDYVLYADNGTPLAIVEAKKTSVSIEKGRHQVDLYGECMKAKYGYKPVLYYTNGYDTKVIDGCYPDRKVVAFHTKDELQYMLQRRERGSITDTAVNTDIAGRPYQQIAVTKLIEGFNEKRRRGLIVMATGTGKTRLAISLVDILARNDWVKSVLFLADRTALVNQAKMNFDKLLPNMQICVLSGSGDKDFSARLMFSTYQTMINYIDAEDKIFSSGRFDLIIIDEAHRSIFNRYGAIFKYFDALVVGLTATPKDEVNANTYSLLGCESGIPDYNYDLADAIKEHYLVGYEVINRTSKLISEGIDFSKLTPEEIQQLIDAGVDLSDPDLLLGGNTMFKKLYNKKTCELVLNDLMTRGLRVSGGEIMGKTIIFAYNHKHAEMIVNCFREKYPDYPANTCQLVDYSVNYGDDLVVKFDTDPEFRIAVSVDMLDTGVDVPAVLNLVFFKPVRSKIKFVQMIGRGTRLCPNIYGPGKDKDKFLIFDYCGNFEFFEMNAKESTAQQQQTLTQRLFDAQLDLMQELQRIEYQLEPYTKAYYEELKAQLKKDVKTVKSHDSRIQVRTEMGYVDKYCDENAWLAVSPVNVKELKMHISPLLDGGLKGCEQSVAFDIVMLKIELQKAQNSPLTGRYVERVMRAAQFLITKKASIPQVLSKAALLLSIVNGSFWASCSIEDMENARKELRDIMQFLVDDREQKHDINITDVIDDSDYTPEGTAVDIRTYRQKVIDYLAENQDNEVINKIRNIEPIDSNDLKELERILWEELGTEEEYKEATGISNLAAFVRSLTGLSREAVNDKFGEYLTGNRFNSQQQEFIQTIVNYVQENGDIELGDIINTEPFSGQDIVELFGVDVTALKSIVEVLHGSIIVAA